MSVTFLIPGPLRPLAGGAAQIDVAERPRTVAEALEGLWRLHPGLRDRLVDEQGRLRQHVNVFVGGESIRDTGGLTTSLEGPVEIAIIPAVSGGCAQPAERSTTTAVP